MLDAAFSGDAAAAASDVDAAAAAAAAAETLAPPARRGLLTRLARLFSFGLHKDMVSSVDSVALRRRLSSDGAGELDAVKLTEHDSAAAEIELSQVPGILQGDPARRRMPSMIEDAAGEAAAEEGRRSSRSTKRSSMPSTISRESLGEDKRKSNSMPASLKPAAKPILRRHSTTPSASQSMSGADGPPSRRISFAPGVSEKSTGGKQSRSSATPLFRRYGYEE